MLRNLLVLVFVAVRAFCDAPGVDAHAARIDKLMSTLNERGQFNGAILVAKQGEIMYRKGFGKANFQTGADCTPETPSNIDSVAKQFTAVAIMILAEQKKLSDDDPIRNTFQNSPAQRISAKLL